MPDRVVGLILDDDTVHAVERRRRSGEVVRVGACELPHGAVVRGEIVDIDAVAEVLRRLWTEAQFSTGRVVVGLDARAAVLRRVELPAMAARDRDDAARYEVGELLGYPIDEAVVSSVEVSAGTGGGTELLTLAVRDRVLAGFAAACTSAGLRPSRCEFVQGALAAQAIGDLGGGSALGLVINAGRSQTDLVIHDRSGIVFGRSLPLGVGSETTSLFDELEMELAALNASLSPALLPDPGPRESSSLAGLLEGIANTLSYFTGEISTAPISRISLAGSEHAVPLLASALVDYHPTAEVVVLETPGVASDEDAAGLVAAAAVAQVALQPRRGRQRHFDIETQRSTRRREYRRRSAVGFALAALAAPVLTQHVLDHRSAVEAREAEVAAVSAELDAALARADASVELRERAATAAAAEALFDRLAGNELGLTTAIRQLAETLPDDAYLLSIQVRQASVGERPVSAPDLQPVAVVSMTGVVGDLGTLGEWMPIVEESTAFEAAWLTNTAVAGLDGDASADAIVFTLEAAMPAPAVPPRNLAGVVSVADAGAVGADPAEEVGG